MLVQTTLSQSLPVFGLETPIFAVRADHVVLSHVTGSLYRFVHARVQACGNFRAKSKPPAEIVNAHHADLVRIRHGRGKGNNEVVYGTGVLN